MIELTITKPTWYLGPFLTG